MSEDVWYLNQKYNVMSVKDQGFGRPTLYEISNLHGDVFSCSEAERQGDNEVMASEPFDDPSLINSEMNSSAMEALQKKLASRRLW